MANTQRRDDEPTRSRRVRGALAPLGRASAAATACILWVGLAMPGLQLLPGAGGFGDRSIAISLQSALLGIDNGYASTPEVRAAMRALGLAVISQSPGPQLQTDGPVSLAVDLAESIRADTVDTTVTPTLVSDGPHNRPSAGTDAPAGTPPSHEQPAAPPAPAEPSAADTAARRRRHAAEAAEAAVGADEESRSRSASPRRPRPPSSAAAYAVGASASSGLPVSFSLAPGERRRLHDLGRDRQLRRRRERAPSGRTRRATRATRRRRRSRSPSRSSRAPSRRSASRHRLRRAQRWAIPPTPSAQRRPPGCLSSSRPPLRAPGSAPCRAPPSPSSAAGHVHRQRGSARRCDLRRRAPRAAVVHDRRPVGAERPVDQLHVVCSVGRVRRWPHLRRLRVGELRPARQLLDRSGKRRRLLAVRCDGVIRRLRHLHDPRRPGRERELPGRPAGLAVLRREHRRPDDQLHVDAAGWRGHRRPDATP